MRQGLLKYCSYAVMRHGCACTTASYAHLATVATLQIRASAMAETSLRAPSPAVLSVTVTCSTEASYYERLHECERMSNMCSGACLEVRDLGLNLSVAEWRRGNVSLWMRRSSSQETWI